MHLGSAKHCCSFTIFHSQFQYWLQTKFYTAYKVFARYRQMPSAGNQTFGNLGSDLRRRTLRAIELEKFGASTNSLLVFLPAFVCQVEDTLAVFGKMPKDRIFAQVRYLDLSRRKDLYFVGLLCWEYHDWATPCVCVDNATTLVYSDA